MSDIHSVYSLPDTEVTESKCTIFSFTNGLGNTRYWKYVLLLADSVHSVGIVSELTTLQTVPSQEAPAIQQAAPELQFSPD